MDKLKANQYVCTCCGEIKTSIGFYKGVGTHHGRVMPICRDCCIKKLEKNSLMLGIEGAMWCLLAEFDVPFIYNVFKTAQSSASLSASKSKKPLDLVGWYLKKLGEAGTVYQGFWDSDTMLTDLLNKQVKGITISDVNDIESMRKKWGKYEDYNDAYPFLEETYNAYTEELFDMDANLENRYKDLCIAEYAKRKAQQSGDIQEMSKAQDNVTKLLKLLKLDDFKENKQSDEEKRVERMAWLIENTKPSECEDLEKYKDFSGFTKTWNDIRRCVQNLVAGSKDYPDIPKDVM